MAAEHRGERALDTGRIRWSFSGNKLILAGLILPMHSQEVRSMYFTKVLMRAAALSVAAAVGMCYLSYRESVRADALVAQGVATVAAVEGIRWKNVGSSRSDFKLDLAFDSRQGEPHHATVLLDDAHGMRISAEAEHAGVAIKYLPGDPDIVQVIGMPLQTSTARYLLMACLASLLAMMCLYSGWKRHRRQRTARILPR
jgi:hypothetical protein